MPLLRRPLLPLATLALLLLATVGAAQSVRGTVSLTGEPRRAAGVVLMLIDSTGVATARALSNEAGEFVLRAERAGRYHVRALRIGFRPENSAPLRLTVGEEVRLPLTLSSLPVSLDTVRVSSRSSCGSPTDSLLPLHTVWNQVRTALTAAQLTMRIDELSATLLAYERVMDPTFPRVRRQSSSFMSAFTGRPWRTASVDSLRRHGYVVTDVLGNRIFFAPDLPTLLSDAFVEDHCFRMARRSTDERLGIEFEPTRERSQVPEISGTVWLTRGSAELQSMEFRYEGLSSSEENGRPGGSMDFMRLSGGQWAISRWNIRMPVLRMAFDRTSATSGTSQQVWRLDEVRVAGGELVSVMRGDDTVWARAPMVVTARIQDSTFKRALAGARVSLRGTTQVDTSDRDGDVAFRNVLPGEYTVDIATPALDSVFAAHWTPVALSEEGSITLRVPDGSRAAADYCGFNEATSPPLGMAVGAVMLKGDSTPPWNVSVVAEWKSGDVARSADARTDALGRYRICGIPTNAKFTLRTELDDTTTAPRPMQFARSTRYARADIEIDAPKSAAGTLFAGAVLSLFSREPLVNAEIALPDLGISARTNEGGRFRISGVPSGTHRVSVRRIGYGAIEQPVSFALDRTTSRQFRLIQVPTLDTVTVTADRRLLEFEEHRQLGLGKFLTRAELSKMEQRELAHVLGDVQGVGVLPGLRGHSWLIQTSRSTGLRPAISVKLDLLDSLNGARSGACYANVYVDNVMVFGNRSIVGPQRQSIVEPLFDLSTLEVNQIEAIEVYPSELSVPARYMGWNAKCGVVVIHTRRGR